MIFQYVKCDWNDKTIINEAYKINFNVFKKQKKMDATKLEFLKEFFETFHKNRKFRDDGHVLCKWGGIKAEGRSYFKGSPLF